MINGTMTAKAYRTITRNEARNTINFNTAITSYNYRDSTPLRCTWVQFDLLQVRSQEVVYTPIVLDP